jgi:hypothetical protein
MKKIVNSREKCKKGVNGGAKPCFLLAAHIAPGDGGAA